MLLCLRLSAPPWLGGLTAFHRERLAKFLSAPVGAL